MNAEVAKLNRISHRVVLEGREGLEVRGVTDVVSFDEQAVSLLTVCGGMTVEGSALHIHVLSMEEGIVSMDGKVDSIVYYDNEESETNAKTGFFARLFR